MKYTSMINKVFITIILMLVVLILIKSNNSFKTEFYKKVYGTNFSFSYFNNLYNKYIGSLDIINSNVKADTVFNEVLTYKSKEKYEDGVKLIVSSNYLVPVNESGIVVFVGNKDKYGNTIIVQRIDGVDEWYGNIQNTNIKLYDYVKKGSLLGEVNNYFYLLYKKNGNVINYEEYIK